MTRNVILMIASLLSIFLITIHTTDDIVRGMEPGTLFDLIVVPILAVWLYGTLVLRERRLGYIIVLLASLLGLLIPIIHMMGAGVGGALAKSSGGFFFIWTFARARRDFVVLSHALGTRTVGAAAREVLLAFALGGKRTLGGATGFAS